MNKYLYSMLAVAGAASLASCSDEKDVLVANGQEATVTFVAELPDNMQSRAYSDGETANKLYYAVYEADSKTLVIQSDTYINLTAKVEMSLVTGKTYDFLFWAQNEAAPYSIDWKNQTVTVSYTGAVANDEKRDAFFKKETLAIQGASMQSVKLTRPFAQINVGTDDLTADAVKNHTVSSAMVVKNAATKLNLFTGEASDAVEATFAKAEIPSGQNFPVGGYNYLEMGYVLVGDEKTTADIDLAFYLGTESTPINEVTVSYAPLQRNYRTNIYGSLLTSNTLFVVEIVPGFNTPDYDLVWDGKTAIEPTRTDNSGAYLISSAAELAGLAQMVNNGSVSRAGDAYFGKEFKLTCDIDLGGHNWTPIGNSKDNQFAGSFDGQGHTIYNLNVENVEYSGLFGHIADSWTKDVRSIKNINVDGATAKGAHFVGVIVGQIDLAVDSEFTGCSVSNASVTGYYDAATDEDGNKIGILAGFIQGDGGTISGNSVYNSEVTAIRDCGAIAGCLTAGTYEVEAFTNNTVSNVTINVTSNKKNGNFGEIIGRKEPKGIKNESGNMAINVTINSEWDGETLAPVTAKTEIIDGVSVEVYNVNAASQLAYMAQTPNMQNAYIKLNADIDLKDATWVAFGAADRKNETAMFTGTIDGQGYTIKNFYNESNVDNGCAALIASANNATIKNLNVEGAQIKAMDTGAGLVGYIMGQTVIENCNVTVTIENIYQGPQDITGAAIGGLVARVYGENCVIKNCTVNGTIHGTGLVNDQSKIGGVVGFLGLGKANGLVLDGCVSNVKMTGTSDFGMGGILGCSMKNNDVTISNCVNNGNITNEYVSSNKLNGAGGIIGSAQSINFNGEDNNFKILNCTNNGNISAYNVAGAFIGGTANCEFDFSTCVNTGEITLLQ